MVNQQMTMAVSASDIHSTSASAGAFTQPHEQCPKSKKLRRIALGPKYHPGEHAILCGRGKVCSMSAGNLYLKALVNHFLAPYSRANNKAEKSRIVTAIIDAVHALPDGTFIRFEKGQWWQVDDAFAREKIGSLFRDTLFLQYRSSTKAKMAKKKKCKNNIVIAGAADEEEEEEEQARNVQPDVDISSPYPHTEIRCPPPPSSHYATTIPAAIESLSYHGNVSQVSLEEGHLNGSNEEGTTSRCETPDAAVATESGPYPPVMLLTPRQTCFPSPLQGRNIPRQVSASPSIVPHEPVKTLPFQCPHVPPITYVEYEKYDFEEPRIPDDISEIGELQEFLEECF